MAPESREVNTSSLALEKASKALLGLCTARCRAARSPMYLHASWCVSMDRQWRSATCKPGGLWLGCIPTAWRFWSRMRL